MRNAYAVWITYSHSTASREERSRRKGCKKKGYLYFKYMQILNCFLRIRIQFFFREFGSSFLFEDPDPDFYSRIRIWVFLEDQDLVFSRGSGSIFSKDPDPVFFSRIRIRFFLRNPDLVFFSRIRIRLIYTRIRNPV